MALISTLPRPLPRSLFLSHAAGHTICRISGKGFGEGKVVSDEARWPCFGPRKEDGGHLSGQVLFGMIRGLRLTKQATIIHLTASNSIVGPYIPAS